MCLQSRHTGPLQRASHLLTAALSASAPELLPPAPLEQHLPLEPIHTHTIHSINSIDSVLFGQFTLRHTVSHLAGGRSDGAFLS